jgi:hypothetical protein
MMRKINLTLTGVLAVLAFVFTLGAGPIHAQVRTVLMPACPIKATIVPSTKTPFTLPFEDTLGDGISIAGTVQVTDQTSSTISKTHYGVGVHDTGVDWSRTVETLQHATGTETFDKGCTKTDQYGSNNCHWDFGRNVTEAVQDALQEDVTSGKVIVDLIVVQTSPRSLDTTTNVQFTCPVCGGTCTIPVPTRPTILSPRLSMGSTPTDQAEVWDFMTWPTFITTPLPIFRVLIGGFANSQANGH